MLADLSKTNDRILINHQYPGRMLRLDEIKAYNPAHLSDTTAHCSWLSARPEQRLVWQMSVLTAPKTKNGLHQVENHGGSHYHRPYWCHFAKVAVVKRRSIFVARESGGGNTMLLCKSEDQ